MEIPVQGTVLKWAREFRGLSLGEAAERLGLTKTELEEFETEVRKPSLTKFERIGTVYRLPLATLFRRTPPRVPERPPDFRTFEGMEPTQSFEFRVALSNVRSFQAILLTLRSEDEEFRIAQLRQYDFQGNPFEQGENERHAISIPDDSQLTWRPGEGFRRWRAIIERLGVAVYLQKFGVQDDCRGFSLWDESTAPAIIINKAERSENGWVFTLVHEYAHLLIRRPGISDLDFRNPVEAFCNRFAAAFLRPATLLRKLLPVWPEAPIDWDYDTIRDIAHQLKVSSQALAIRLEELDLAKRGLNRVFAVQHRGRTAAGSGGNYVATRLSELGGRYTTAVVNALDREVIDSVHASQALGLTLGHLDDARLYIERQRELASAE